MKKIISIISLLAATCAAVYSQTPPTGQSRDSVGRPPATTPQQQERPTIPQRQGAGFDLSDYGVDFQVDPRLIVMMAALEAAGFDPVPAGEEPSPFRAQVRKDLAQLDPDLRTRLRSFYERNKLPAPATAADQEARYISLAFVLGPAPEFESPPRSEELPKGLLEVLDFAPLLKDFYRLANMEKNLPGYIRAYQAEGDRLRRPTAEMIREVLSYLHTRPITVSARACSR